MRSILPSSCLIYVVIGFRASSSSTNSAVILTACTGKLMRRARTLRCQLPSMCPDLFKPLVSLANS